jgi:hypothetical protein
MVADGGHATGRPLLICNCTAFVQATTERSASLDDQEGENSQNIPQHSEEVSATCRGK